MRTDKNYGLRLKAARRTARLTIKEAAHAEGVSGRLWAYWESGEKLPPAEGERTQERVLAKLGAKSGG